MGNTQRYRAAVVLQGDRSFDFSGTVQRGNIDLDVTEHGSIKSIDLFEPKREVLRAILMREGSADVHMWVRGIAAGGRLRYHLVPSGQRFAPRRIRLVLK